MTPTHLSARPWRIWWREQRSGMLAHLEVPGCGISVEVSLMFLTVLDGTRMGSQSLTFANDGACQLARSSAVVCTLDVPSLQCTWDDLTERPALTNSGRHPTVL